MFQISELNILNIQQLNTENLLNNEYQSISKY